MTPPLATQPAPAGPIRMPMRSSMTITGMRTRSGSLLISGARTATNAIIRRL
jgi:hypothetical protein